jgi:hypothetical protein
MAAQALGTAASTSGTAASTSGNGASADGAEASAGAVEASAAEGRSIGACPLQLMQISPADQHPGGRFSATGEYQMIGAVMIGADSGTDPTSEAIRALVRPRTCAMGGEIISLMASGSGANGYGRAQSNIVFNVWGPRAAVANVAPQAFWVRPRGTTPRRPS